MTDHNKLSAEIHHDNIIAGWWKQIDRVTQPRNIGELLCLTHSEISEGFEGWKLDRYDDHLPSYPMLHVELGDACIRLYDILGFYQHPINIRGVTSHHESIEFLLLQIHLRISQAMEHFRKGRENEGCERLEVALYRIWCLARKLEANLFVIIEEKREYNRNRADHKLENRAKEGGKAF